MAYFTNLFSPETYQAFARSGHDISGFRLRHKGRADRIKPKDFFVCYLTSVSRWFGLLEVLDGPFIDDTPIFVPSGDPFVVRFRVRVHVWLEIDKAIPMYEEAIWTGLSFTCNLPKGSIAWIGKVRSSLARLNDQDGRFLAEKLAAQASQRKPYPIDEKYAKRLASHAAKGYIV